MATAKWKQENRDRMRAYRRDWYARNKEASISKAMEQNKKNADWFAELKSKLSCIICGENHPATLDFHHRDPKEKEMVISRAVKYGRKRILAEMEKCDVLCANCHRKLHYEDGTMGKRK